MYTITIFFVQKTFFLNLWENEKHVSSKIIDDGSKNLLVGIEDLLKNTNNFHTEKSENNSNVNENCPKVGMKNISRFIAIVGPGSFSSIRIAYSTISALKRVFNHMLYRTYYFHDLLDSYNKLHCESNESNNRKNDIIGGFDKCTQFLLIRLNKNIFLLYKNNNWEVVFKKQIIAIQKNELNKSFYVFCPEYCKDIFQDLLDEGCNMRFIENVGMYMNNLDLYVDRENLSGGSSDFSLVESLIKNSTECVKKPLYVYMPVVK